MIQPKIQQLQTLSNTFRVCIGIVGRLTRAAAIALLFIAPALRHLHAILAFIQDALLMRRFWLLVPTAPWCSASRRCFGMAMLLKSQSNSASMLKHQA